MPLGYGNMGTGDQGSGFANMIYGNGGNMGSNGGETLTQGTGNDGGGGNGGLTGVGITTYNNTAITTDYNRTLNDPATIRFLRSVTGAPPPDIDSSADAQPLHMRLGLLFCDLMQKCLPFTSQCTDQGRDLFPTLEMSGGPLVRENGYGGGRGYVYDMRVPKDNVKDAIPFPTPNRQWRASPVFPALEGHSAYSPQLGGLQWTK